MLRPCSWHCVPGGDAVPVERALVRTNASHRLVRWIRLGQAGFLPSRLYRPPRKFKPPAEAIRRAPPAGPAFGANWSGTGRHEAAREGGTLGKRSHAYRTLAEQVAAPARPADIWWRALVGTGSSCTCRVQMRGRALARLLPHCPCREIAGVRRNLRSIPFWRVQQERGDGDDRSSFLFRWSRWVALPREPSGVPVIHGSGFRYIRGMDDAH